MNISRILLFVVLSFSSLCAQKPINISFKIDGYTEGVAQLIGVYADANYLADTAKISKDGRIDFASKTGYSEGLFFLLLPDQKNIQFLIANGENFTLKTKKGDLINGMQVEKSLENQLFFDNQKYQVALEQKFNALTAEMKKYVLGSPKYDSLINIQKQLIDERDGKVVELKEKYPAAFLTKFKLAGQNPRLRFTYRADGSLDSSQTMINYKADWWNDVDFADGRLLHTPVFFNKMKKYMLELTAQNPDSIIKSADFLIDKTLNNKDYFNVAANWITYNNKPGTGTLMDCDAIYSHLILKYFTPERAIWTTPADVASMRKTAKEMQISLIGMTGLDVQAKNNNGDMKSIYGLNATVTVIFIYNPDCEHCQEETPKLRGVYDQWKNRGVEVFSIAANAKNREEWQKFAKNYAVNWTDVWDPELKSKFHEKYYIDITPECYVLDKNHKIIAKNIKPDQLPEIFKRELAKVGK